MSAQEIGARFGDPDLVAFGLVLRGAAMVLAGHAGEGLSLIDEGTLAAVGGELTPYAAGSIYCITIGVCRSVADYRRAGEWTAAATQWCEGQAITGFPGVCRVQRAEIMRLRGRLSEAEDEARHALADFPPPSPFALAANTGGPRWSMVFLLVYSTPVSSEALQRCPGTRRPR